MVPSIQTYKPKNILRKEAFKRAIPGENLDPAGCIGPQGDSSSVYDVTRDNIRYELMSQSDFIREYDVNAHKINSLKYYPNPLAKDKEGKMYAKIKTRVAIACQARIHLKRLTALIGNNVNLRIVSHDKSSTAQASLTTFREGWELKGIETLIHDFISADGKVGDAAANIYIYNNSLGWRVFEFEKGDTLYPHYDPVTGKLCLFGRRYILTDEEGSKVEYLDVWDNTHYCRYIRTNKKEDYEANATLDGWAIDIEPTPHNFPRIPIVYDRYGAPFWANSQSNIDALEMSMSQLAENNMAYALRILYSFGEEMNMSSTVDGTPLRIDSPNPNAKVGFLEPADSSNSFALQISELKKSIMNCSFAVETPELKTGSDMSSLTVKMLFADAYLKAIDDAVHFQPVLDDLVELFKFGYGMETSPSEMTNLRVKAELLPYIFQSETEIINGIVQLKGIGAMSRQSATEMAYESGFGVVGENERIMNEEHDDLVATQHVQSQSNANVISNARNNQ